MHPGTFVFSAATGFPLRSPLMPHWKERLKEKTSTFTKETSTFIYTYVQQVFRYLYVIGGILHSFLILTRGILLLRACHILLAS